MKVSGLRAPQSGLRCGPGCAPEYCAIGLVNPKSLENVGAVMGLPAAMGRRGLHGQASSWRAALPPTPSRWWRRSPARVEELLAFVPEGCTLCWWI